MTADLKIPVARPLLPNRAALAPYLDQIDANRWYSNYGPLCQQLEARLAAFYGLGPDQLTTVANATVGLVAALQAADAVPGRHCLVPSWTFSASVHAVIAAGLIPLFVDVDETGTMTPDIARAALKGTEDVGAVMPVAAYGQPLDPAPWERFQAETGVPVVIDAAPAFDCAAPSSLASVVSLHATKILGVGEGGFVMSTQARLAHRVRLRSNFGFDGTREAQVPATNGKISEYAAAVGLAALDDWAGRRAAFHRVAMRYRTALEGLGGVSLYDGFGDRWLTATCVVRFDRPAAPIAAAFAAAGVETRAWWGRGMHLHPAFADGPRRALPMTEVLADTTLGLPMSMDMPDEAVDRVAGVLKTVLARG